jgi:predicted anti-sigma-YlaC factor YlaD
MTCQELVELVTEYLEGTLAEEQRTRFEAHLVECGGCRNYLEQARQTLRVTHHLTEESLSEPARDELLALFRNWKENS